jgi:PAS domain S-box-containing protein
VPIIAQAQLWGLLVSHHSEPRQFGEPELQVMQLISDQVSIAIAQSYVLNETRLRAAQEATINQVLSFLHSLPEMKLQQALELVVQSLNGSGGRLYLSDVPLVFVAGQQPMVDLPENGGFSKRRSKQSITFMEQHPYWQTWLDMEEPLAQGGWAIADIERSEMPAQLTQALLAVDIHSALIVPIEYHQQRLGYLSIFRQAIDVERIWAGRIDREDPRQGPPRKSFETWRELRQNQARPWTILDIELIQTLRHHFAVAIHQQGLYQRVNSLNASLKRDIQKRKQVEVKLSALNTQLEQRVIERTTQLQKTNLELLRQIDQRELEIQERQRAEASLARLSYQNQLILNSAGDGIYGLDSHGKITFVNPAAARMLGDDIDHLIGQWMHVAFSHARTNEILYLLSESPIYATLRNGTIQHQTGEFFQRKDGTSFPVEYVSSPIQEHDRIIGAVVIFKDITERQQIEQMKDEFVSIVSHELRTPLTSIRSTLGLLSSGWLESRPEKSQRMLEIAFSNTNRLVRLISDILDIERIKFGKVMMEKQRCNATSLMVQSTDAMRAMAEKAGVSLSIHAISAELWVDPDRIIQTVTNLLNNAIKFSSSGATVTLTAEINSVNSSEILFCIQDEGIGIPEDKLDIIFDRFQQVDASNSRTQGGTGLGLTICREIIQQHGGRIWAESHLGVGSRFYFSLPLMSDSTSLSANHYEQANSDH